MPIGALVINRGAALQNFLQLLGGINLAFPGCSPNFLGQRQDCPAIAVAHADQRGAGFLIQRQGLVRPPPRLVPEVARGFRVNGA